MNASRGIDYEPTAHHIPARYDRKQNDSAQSVSDALTAAFDERVRSNQEKLQSELKASYDFIVCGSGSSGSVVARRLAENADVTVLLLEAGGSDDVPSVMQAVQWPLNVGSERDWNFDSQPESHLNGRIIPLAMGKVPGRGSSINAMTYSRGHKNDWDFFASEANDPAWSYDSVLNIANSRMELTEKHPFCSPLLRGPCFRNASTLFQPRGSLVSSPLFSWPSRRAEDMQQTDLFACHETPNTALTCSRRWPARVPAGWCRRSHASRRQAWPSPALPLG